MLSTPMSMPSSTAIQHPDRAGVLTSRGAPRPASRMGTACGRRGGLPRSEWETTNVKVSRRRRSSRSHFDAAGHQGPALEPSVGILSRCQSRSRTRADSASLAKAEAKTALIAYAAAARSWAATWATPLLARPQERRTSPGRAVHVRQHSPRMRPGAHHACALRRGSMNDQFR